MPKTSPMPKTPHTIGRMRIRLCIVNNRRFEPHIHIRIWRTRSNLRARKLNFWKLLFRAWFYFRTGYGLYLAFLIGFASNIVVLYKLGVVDNKYLAPFFPSLTVFGIVSLIVAAPIAIFSGLYHMKRTGAFAADAAVQTESNPYIYRAVPGKEKEVFVPLMMLTARGLAKVMEQLKTMTPEEKTEFEDVLAKADVLLKGQAVGLTSQRSRT